MTHIMSYSKSFGYYGVFKTFSTCYFFVMSIFALNVLSKSGVKVVTKLLFETFNR